MKNIFVFFILFFSMANAKASDCSLKLENLSEAADYNYVIVPGIFNEFMPYYMTEHRRYLLSLGVPSHQIFRVNNKSYIRPQGNVQFIKNMVDKIRGEKKIVFITHSKGALETLYYLLKTPDLSRIEKVFLIQGALDGASSYKMVMRDRPTHGVFKYVKMLSRFGVIKDFSEAFDAKYVRNQLSGLSFKKELLSKITFIESEKKLSDLAPRFSVLGGLYQENFKSAGDGVLLKTDHVPSELQRNKSVCRRFYEVDHGDFVKAAPWESLRISRIKSFMKELLLGFKRDQ